MDFTRVAGVLGGLGVAAGAFGAHGLKGVAGVTEPRIAAFATGAHYQVLHAVAVGALAAKSPRAALLWSIGTAVFSGSLYLYGYTGNKTFGMVAPIGGTLLIAGWVALAL